MQNLGGKQCIMGNWKIVNRNDLTDGLTQVLT